MTLTDSFSCPIRRGLTGITSAAGLMRLPCWGVEVGGGYGGGKGRDDLKTAVRLMA